MADPIKIRLCDEQGMVSHEQVPLPEGSQQTFIDRLNYFKTFSANPDARKPYEGEPFPCTGSMSIAGDTIYCNNPFHRG